jgi:hypothetical protein
MANKILVSRGLPSENRDLIPSEVDIDENGLERALSKGELVSRLQGSTGSRLPVLTEKPADFAWAPLMAVARRVVDADTFARSGQCKPPLTPVTA